MVSVMRSQDTGFSFQRIPSWFRQDVPDMSVVNDFQKRFQQQNLHTVCQSAHCPNIGECWQRGVATFMILGDVCTRGCRFCAVKMGEPLPPDHKEPENVARMVKDLGLQYCVITSVTRDDLDDYGAKQFELTIKAIKQKDSQIKVEVLVPDFCGSRDSIKRVLGAGPDVFAHNIEMAESVFFSVRPQADYQRSLDVLRIVTELSPGTILKSGLMVGLGETDDDVIKTMKDLYMAGCRIMTIGQYLAPSREERHVSVKRFVEPQVFDDYRDIGEAMGFGHVVSGPLVRSSYLAQEAYTRFMERQCM